MKKIALLALTSALILSGCKVDIETPVNVSDLNSEQSKEVLSTMSVQVASCSDFQDSRNDSRSLIQAKNEVANIFPNANFVECYSKNFEDLATFTIPVNVGSKEGDINIFGNDKGHNFVSISKNLASKIEKLKRSGMSKITPSITILLKNDTNEEKHLQLVLFSVFVDNNGTPVGTFELENNKVIKLKLSDVSTDSIIKSDGSIFMTTTKP